MKDHAFTTKQLANLGLPGAPGTAEGWRGIVTSEEWDYNEHPGRGRGGIRREYIPPPPLLLVIQRHLRGETITIDDVRAARMKRAGFAYKPGLSGFRRPVIASDAVAPYAGEEHAADNQQRQQLMLRLGLLTHDATWLPEELDLGQRATLATRAYAALHAMAANPEILMQLAGRDEVLELALRLAWAIAQPDAHPPHQDGQATSETPG